MLASALRAFHSVNATDCPFEAYVPGESLVHGDACLPNIVVGDDGLNGYIDLDDIGVGDVEVDLSAAVWSLQYKDLSHWSEGAGDALTGYCDV